MVIDVKIKDLSKTNYNLDKQSFPVIIKNNAKEVEMGMLYVNYKKNIFEFSFYRDLTKGEKIVLMSEIFYGFALDYYYRFRGSEYKYKIEYFRYIELNSIEENDYDEDTKLEKSVIIKDYFFNHIDEVNYIDTCCGRLIIDIKDAYDILVGEFENYYKGEDLVSRCKKLKDYNRKELIAFYTVVLDLINARGHHVELFNIIKNQDFECTYHKVIFLRDKEKSSYKRK